MNLLIAKSTDGIKLLIVREDEEYIRPSLLLDILHKFVVSLFDQRLESPARNRAAIFVRRILLFGCFFISKGEHGHVQFTCKLEVLFSVSFRPLLPFLLLQAVAEQGALKNPAHQGGQNGDDEQGQQHFDEGEAVFSLRC
jgi:hypothetical protein